MKCKRNQQRGFMFIELLMIIAVVFLISAIMIPVLKHKNEQLVEERTPLYKVGTICTMEISSDKVMVQKSNQRQSRILLFNGAEVIVDNSALICEDK